MATKNRPVLSGGKLRLVSNRRGTERRDGDIHYTQSGGDGVPGNIDLASLPNATNVVVNNSGGVNATILEATDIRAGVITAVDHVRLNKTVVYQGDWDASTGAFPTPALLGYTYTVSVGGTVDGVTFNAGDEVTARIDNPSTTTYAANWWQTNNTGSAVSNWTVVSAAANLNAGDYILDSRGGAFAATLVEEVGEWEFSDSFYSTQTNNVTIGTAGQTFTDQLGNVVNGPMTIDVDGGHFKVVNTDGSANFYVVGFAGGMAVANDHIHADDTNVAPATAGQPTRAEIQTFVTANNLTDVTVYYTGNDVANLDNATHVYHIDASGDAVQIEKPGSSSIWTLVNAATLLSPGDYIVDSTAATFAITLTQVAGEWEFSDSLFQLENNNITIGTAVQTFTNENGVVTPGPLTADVKGVHFKIVNLDGSNNYFVVGNPSGGSALAKNHEHADDTTVAPVLAGQPTLTEIQTFVTANGFSDLTLYYTGDDTASFLNATHIYSVDGAGDTVLVEEPGSAANWTLVNANSVLGKGDYILNASGGTFAITLVEEQGEWEFGDPNYTTGTNIVAVGTAAQTFTDQNGVQAAGPFNINVDGAHVKLINVDGSSNFLVVSEPKTAFQGIWTLVTTSANLSPGDYVLNSSAAAFNIALSQEIGEWEFGDPNFTTATNNVSIGTPAQTFTDNTGAQVAGPLAFDVDGAHIKLINTDGSANFLLIV